MRQDAVIYQLKIKGKAVKNMDQITLQVYSDTPWLDIGGI